MWLQSFHVSVLKHIKNALAYRQLRNFAVTAFVVALHRSVFPADQCRDNDISLQVSSQVSKVELLLSVDTFVLNFLDLFKHDSLNYLGDGDQSRLEKGPAHSFALGHGLGFFCLLEED